ncbi:MAG: hypothetical protein E4H40_03040 [Candidatus Brocadiia bacterium]|nr:MAG: hypothetical protein E4H40_03040 [Candidatus Brocadiia bacterium]
MKKMLFLIPAVWGLLLFGCGEKEFKAEVSQGPNPWTNLNFYNKAENFQFAVMSDRTGGHIPGIYEDAISKVNLLKPEFVMSVGDLIEGDSKDKEVLRSQWDEFDGIIGKLEMPFFYLPGNHDFSSMPRAQLWNERLGRSYYHFVYRDVLFLCFNTEELPETTLISQEQLEYFTKTLKRNSRARWVLVFMHKPMWEYLGKNPAKEQMWQKFETLLAGKNFTVFAGHKHRYGITERNGHKYYVLSINQKGQQVVEQCRFDHFMWVTMTDNGPDVANVMLNGITGDEPCPKEGHAGQVSYP